MHRSSQAALASETFLACNKEAGFPDDPAVKASACRCSRRGLDSGREEPLEEEMATHSCVLAWRSPWTEEPGGLQSVGCRVGNDLATKQRNKEARKVSRSQIKIGLKQTLGFYKWSWSCTLMNLFRGRNSTPQV